MRIGALREGFEGEARVAVTPSSAGHLMKLETNRLLDGRKRFRGKVTGVEGDSIRLDRDQPEALAAAAGAPPL